MTRVSRFVPRGGGDARETSARGRVLSALVVAAAIPLGLLRGGEPAPEPVGSTAADERPEAGATPGVLVAMHLDEPLAADRTVVWTAAFQAAWDALDAQVRERWHVPRFDLGPPAPPADVRALENGRLEPGIVDPKDLTVIAGPATEETWHAVDRASDLGRPAGTPAPRDLDLVAFARLKASIRYEVPFHVEPRPLAFGPARTAVRAYGLEADASGAAADRMRAQVDLHLDRTSSEGEPARRAVVVLKGVEGRRVVISGRPPKATLRATWDDVASAVRTLPATGFSTVDRLAVPRVAIVAGRSFDALLGAAVRGVPGSTLAVAREDVRLAADEKGADGDAEAVLVDVGAMSIHVVFDGPFLLAMCASGSDRPYALAWLGSADGLSRWGEPVGRRLAAAEAAPFAGAWTLDREASVEATLVRWGKALAASGRRPGWTPEHDRKPLRDHLAAQSFDAVVARDGLVTLTRGRVKAIPETAQGPLVRDGARVLLAVPTASLPAETDEPVLKDEPSGVPTGQAAPPPRGEARWSVSRDGDRLVLAEVGAGITVVLVRR